MPSELKIPRYQSGRVQEIIKNDVLSVTEKADMIYRFDEYILKRKGRRGVTPRRPLYDRIEIKNALIELEKEVS